MRKRDEKKERKKKEDASIHRESIVSFISVPRADYLFRFPAGRAPHRSSYCDSVIVVRFWKIAHCESILKTGGLTESCSSLPTNIWDMREFLRSKKTDQDRSMLIFLRLTSRFISFISFHVEHILTPPFICGFSTRDRLILSESAKVTLRKFRFPNELSSKER